MDIWIIAMVLEIGRHEVIVKPYAYVESYCACVALLKSIEAEQNGIPMTCTRESEA